MSQRTALTWIKALLRDRGGNTLALIAAALFPMLALLGGGIDMGRSYLSQSRLQQACDSGVLAARKKLGSAVVTTGVIPADVAEVGNRFFNLNFHDGAYGTSGRTFSMTLEEDYSISGEAHVDVPTTIMSLFGYSEMPIPVKCEAKLNFANTDIMFVLDTTGSMADTNPGDNVPKIDALKQVVRDFHDQLEGAKGPGTRLRYGFVPYSTNVNVGALLKDDWVVNAWTYQSRENYGTEPGTVQDYTYDTNWNNISGSALSSAMPGPYPATYHSAASEASSAYYSCDTAPPASTSNSVYTLISTTSEPYVGPPAGTKVTKHYRVVTTGTYYWVELNGTTCVTKKTVYSNFTQEFDKITIPYTNAAQRYRYAPIARDVRNWRNESNGCMEERETYEIDDWSDVDLSRALDLDIDTVPTAGDPKTQWRPEYPNIIYERSIYGNNSGSFTPAPVVTTEPWFFQPGWIPNMITCPSASRKLAEMDSTQVNTYLATVNPGGTTYHDIGMIWGGRLLSPTGLFAAENGDIDGKTTSRNLIFLTDGQTEPYDIAYGAYGVEPLDQRRWKSNSPISLTETVEKRFGVACAEVKKRNINVWVIGFGTTLNPVMTECAGPGHFFEASNAAELQDVFSNIAAHLGDLRISK
ncbi:MAG: pilus assembly protein TadG-related protein [Novosphingobium sp.]